MNNIKKISGLLLVLGAFATTSAIAVPASGTHQPQHPRALSNETMHSAKLNPKHHRLIEQKKAQVIKQP